MGEVVGEVEGRRWLEIVPLEGAGMSSSGHLGAGLGEQHMPPLPPETNPLSISISGRSIDKHRPQ